jgi:hypothetical protein
MAQNKRSVRVMGVWLLGLCLAICLSCESKDKYAGTYETKDKRGEIRIELKPNGDGVWIAGTQEVSFSWYIKGGDLRVNTKEGGVLVGKFEGNAIRITLPVRGEMVLKKTQ